MKQLCGCGCGESAPIAKRSDTRQGMVKGQPQRYVNGHNRRRSPEPYREEDRGYKTPCWIWQRAISNRGYGSLGRKGRTHSAHRWYYMERFGPVPDGYEVDHKCRVPACVNPDHLEAVTKGENLRRAHAKLDTLQVDQILAHPEISAREFARRFSVSHMTTARVRRQAAGWG